MRISDWSSDVCSSDLVDNFRSGPAKAMRDAAYRRRSIAFLQQASRYRGKANYRDAIFLAYGKTVAPRLEGLVADLLVVLEGFTAMAAGYCSLRLGQANWGPLLQDLADTLETDSCRANVCT